MDTSFASSYVTCSNVSVFGVVTYENGSPVYNKTVNFRINDAGEDLDTSVITDLYGRYNITLNNIDHGNHGEIIISVKVNLYNYYGFNSIFMGILV